MTAGLLFNPIDERVRGKGSPSVMIVAVASENRKRVTGHAGSCRNFWIYEVENCRVKRKSLLELPSERSFYENQGDDTHRLPNVRVLITGGMDVSLKRLMKRIGVFAVVTLEVDPDRAVRAFFAGTLETVPSGRIHGNAYVHPD